MPHIDNLPHVNVPLQRALRSSGYEPELYSDNYVFNSEAEVRQAYAEGKITSDRVSGEIKKLYFGEPSITTERIARGIVGSTDDKREALVTHLTANTFIGEPNVTDDRDSLNSVNVLKRNFSTNTMNPVNQPTGSGQFSGVNQGSGSSSSGWNFSGNTQGGGNNQGGSNMANGVNPFLYNLEGDQTAPRWAESASPWDGWAPVLGAYTPQQQYTALMGSTMPNYNIPGFSNLYQSQFDPTFGQYLLGGYGGGTGLGTTERFSDWFRNRPTGDLGAGWNLAQQFGRTMPGGTDYATLAQANPGMAYAMTQPDAIQAMAQARYFQGQDPRKLGGYATRAVQSTLGNLFTNWQRKNIASADPQAPGAFLSDLGRYGGRWA